MSLQLYYYIASILIELFYYYVASIILLCRFNYITMLLQLYYYVASITMLFTQNDDYNRYFRLLHVNSIIFVLISGLSSFAFPSAFVSQNFREHETID